MSTPITAIRFPFAIDGRLGRLAQEHDYEQYIEQLIRQVLFTAQGERINRWRVQISDMNYLKSEVFVGMAVFVYGNTMTRDEVVPPEMPEVLDRGLIGALDLPAATS